MREIQRIAIIGGNRIPFARSNTVYSNVSNQEMMTATLQGLADRFNLHNECMGEVAGGAVIKHSRDYNLVRESTLSTSLAPETPAFDLQQACGTGLEACILIGNKIALGQIENGIACGVDSTSDAPIAINEKLRRILLEINSAKSSRKRLSILLLHSVTSSRIACHSCPFSHTLGHSLIGFACHSCPFSHILGRSYICVCCHSCIFSYALHRS